MGINQQFRTSASWDQAVNLLDHSFPLVQGSHRTASTYLVYFDHLLVIQADGSTTGLSNPSQFVEAEGDGEAPESILLDNHGLQVEIEPSQATAGNPHRQPRHRMQLLTQLHTA